MSQIFLWTDSTIVLDWLNMPTFKLKTFIANRVAAITEWTNTKSWRHVHGVSNPADLASRGTCLLYTSLLPDCIVYRVLSDRTI